jgi:hypothetical protein
MLFSQAFEDRHFTKREISCAIVGRRTRETVPSCAAFFPYLAMPFRGAGSDLAPCGHGLPLITTQ